MFKAPFAIPVPHKIVDDMTPYCITPYATPGVHRSPERINKSKPLFPSKKQKTC